MLDEHNSEIKDSNLKEKRSFCRVVDAATLINPKRTQTLIMLCSLNSLKEALFLLLAPFFPEQMKLKQVPELYYAPLFA